MERISRQVPLRTPELLAQTGAMTYTLLVDRCLWFWSSRPRHYPTLYFTMSHPWLDDATGLNLL